MRVVRPGMIVYRWENGPWGVRCWPSCHDSLVAKAGFKPHRLPPESRCFSTTRVFALILKHGVWKMHQIVLENGTIVKEVNFIIIDSRSVQGFGIVPIMVANGRRYQSSVVIEIWGTLKANGSGDDWYWKRRSLLTVAKRRGPHGAMWQALELARGRRRKNRVRSLSRGLPREEQVGTG